jgi:hypothetical protein
VWSVPQAGGAFDRQQGVRDGESESDTRGAGKRTLRKRAWCVLMRLSSSVALEREYSVRSEASTVRTCATHDFQYGVCFASADSRGPRSAMLRVLHTELHTELHCELHSALHRHVGRGEGWHGRSGQERLCSANVNVCDALMWIVASCRGARPVAPSSTHFGICGTRQSLGKLGYFLIAAFTWLSLRWPRECSI